MKNRHKIKLLFFCFFAILSCKKYETLRSQEELKFAFIANSSSTFNGYYYLGEKDGFQYFKSDWKFFPEYFKIRNAQIIINSNYTSELGNKELKIGVLQSQIIFGETKYTKIYIENENN